MNIIYHYNSTEYNWKNLGTEEAKRRIEDLVNAKGYTEQEAINEVLYIEHALEDMT